MKKQRKIKPSLTYNDKSSVHLSERKREKEKTTLMPLIQTYVGMQKNTYINLNTNIHKK